MLCMITIALCVGLQHKVVHCVAIQQLYILSNVFHPHANRLLPHPTSSVKGVMQYDGQIKLRRRNGSFVKSFVNHNFNPKP